MFQKGKSGNPAGRPKGALGKTTRAIAERVAKEGVTPLEVLTQIMRERWTFYQQELKKPLEGRDVQALAKAVEGAILAAEKAAPYMHPKLAAIEHSGEVEHSYVARTPAVSNSVEEWQKQYAPQSLQ